MNVDRLRTTHDTELADEVVEIRTSADRWRFVFGLTLLLVSVLLWGAWFEIAAHERKEYLKSTARRQTNLAISAEHYVVRVLRSTDAIANLLSAAPHAAGSDEALLTAMVGRVRNNDILTAAAVCFRDDRWLSTTVQLAADLQTGLCRTWAQDRMGNGGRTHIATPVSVGGELTVPVTYALEGSGSRAPGILVMFVNVRRLLGLLEDYSIAENTSVVVFGADGATRARWHSHSQTRDQVAPEIAMLPALVDQPPGTRATDANGQARFATLRQLQNYPLSVLVSTAEPDVVREYTARLSQYAWASAIASVVLASVFLFLLRMHSRSVRLAESLGRARERLSALNAGLELQVHERTRELEDAYRDLEAFTYTVAHDVRAPIASIRGFASVVLPAVEQLGDERMAHYMRRIVANATQMNDLTESLLELGKLTRAPVVLSAIDLTAMARDVATSLREAEKAERDVVVDVQDGIVVMADRVLIRQVLQNLMGNAWKFTSRRAQARIGVIAARDPQQGWVVVTVSDNGAGFDTSKSGDIFKPFHRMHATSEFPGSGVGLATVQRIVRLHGGRVWIESAESEGTRVHFTMPEPGPAD